MSGVSVVTEGPPPGHVEPHAHVVVYPAALLADPPGTRQRPPRPLAAECVRQGGHVVVGRRGSVDDPSREPDGDGVRLALPQRRPMTSRRHVELVHDGRWMVRVLDTVKTPAELRAWARFAWEPAEPGTRRVLSPGRPLALRLPGDPAYVVVISAGPAAVVAPVAPTGGSTLDVTADELRPLGASGVETVARIYHDALRWPPRTRDDALPGWSNLRGGDGLRKAYGRLVAEVGGPLGLDTRNAHGPDELLPDRLAARGVLDYARVQGVADTWDVAMASLECPCREVMPA